MEAQTKTKVAARHLGSIAAVLLALLVLLGAITLTRNADADRDAVRTLETFQRSLNVLHDDILDADGDYWATASGAQRAGTDPLKRLKAAGTALSELAGERTAPAEVDLARTTQSSLDALGRSLTAHQAAQTPAGTARAATAASAAMTRIDTTFDQWTTIIDSDLEQRHERFSATRGRALIGLGSVAALLLLAGTLVWAIIDRKRRFAMAAVADERDENDAVMGSVQDGLAVVTPDGTISRANDHLAQIVGHPVQNLLGTRPVWATELDDSFTGEAEVTIHTADGNRHLLLNVSPLPGDRGTLHAVKDVTARRAAETELHDVAVEREVLRRVATFVAGGAEPAAVFDLVASETANLLGADAAVVTRFDLQTDRTIDVGTWVDPTSSAARPPARIPLDGHAPTATVFQTGRPARVEDFADIDPTSSELLITRGYRSGAAAPVQVGSVRWGAVAVLAHERRAFPAGVEDRLARFAELVGLTVANADARARLASQAATDPLTGLANHRAFHERLDAEVARARHDQTELSLVMIDLDNFKDVNDTFGHHVGDAVLSEAARRLAGEARYGEVVARIGGEEFAWILPGSDGLNAWRAAERARRAVSQTPFADGVGTLTASAGVADLSQATDGAMLMRLADGALYWAKASGRDATFRYSPDVVRELSASERAERLARTQAVTALRALARAVDAKDPSTARHAERVAAVAVKIGHLLGWTTDRLELLREAALLHDVGKIGVPDNLLFKPDRLTGDERRQVEAHAALGAEIVSDVLSPEQVSWVRGHHERWDGLGYPDRLSGDALAEGARIICVADAWDAMTSVRTYGTTSEGNDAILKISAEQGRQFSPAVVQALVELWNSGALDADQVTPRNPATSPQPSVDPT